MSYNVLLSDIVSEYLNSQDRNRQKAILKHFHEMRDDPLKGDVIRLKPPFHRLYRKRIGSDRLLFSIRSEDVFLEIMSRGVLRQKGGKIHATTIIEAINKCDLELDGMCEIEGDLIFSGDVNTKIIIKNSLFRGVVNFHSSHFKEAINFNGCYFNEKISFSGAHFNGAVKFVDVEFKKRTHFDQTIFYAGADFDFSIFHNDVSFNGARFPTFGNIQIIEFNHAIFKAEAEFSNLYFDSDYKLKVGNIKNVYSLVKRLIEATDLRQPWWWRSMSDDVSSFIKTYFVKDSDIFSDIYNEKSNGEKLVSLLNQVISGNSLIKEKCFENVATKKTREAIRRNPNKINYHNRLLLADAYPKMIDDLVVIRIGFIDAKFHGISDFSNSKYIEADFRDAIFYNKTLFCYCEFEGIANFHGAIFDRDCNFYQSIFHGNAKFSGAIFEKEAKWNKSSFISDFILNNTKIHSMQFEKISLNTETKITLTDAHFDLLIIPWNILKDHLLIEPEMDSIYLSLIMNFKELGWWKDADDCSFQYNLYKNESKLVKILAPNLDHIRKLKLDLPEFMDLAAWLCGYGIKIEYLIMPALLIIFISGIFFNVVNYPSESIIDSFKNSTLIFLSGNLFPQYNYIAACENFLRALVFGVFVVILTRKLFR